MSKVTLTDVQTGYRVTSVINDNNATIEQAFDNTLSRDGSTPNAMEAPLDMGGHKVLNVTAGTAAADAVNKAQLDSLGQNLPQSVIDQIATRVVDIINEGGGVVAPPGGYTNPPAPTSLTTSGVTYANVTLTIVQPSTTWVEGYYLWRNGTLLDTIRSAATLTYNDTSVVPLTTYTYSVSAFNETYDYETARTAATPVTVPANTQVTSPGTPTSVVLAENPTGQARLTWAYNSAAPNEFFYIRRNGSELTTVGPAQRSYTDTIPPYGVSLTYTVTGWNSGYGEGTSGTSNSVTITAPVVVTPPTAPTGVTVSAISTTSLNVAWVYGGDTHTGFIVTTTGLTGIVSQLTVNNKAQRNIVVSGLTPSTTYSVVVSTFTYTPPSSITDYPAAAVTGTTSAGTSVAAPTFSTSNPSVFVGRIGDSAAGIQPIQAASGSGSYTFATTTTLPTGLTLVSTGLWSGTPSTYANGLSVSVTITDTVTGLTTTGNVLLTINYAVLTLTPPSGIASNLVATQSSPYASGNWTITGGDGTYSKIVNGTLPSSITPTYGSATVSINGTSSLAVAGIYPFTISVSSGDGQNTTLSYDLDYRQASGNRPPVQQVGATLNYNMTEGTATATLFDADNLYDDPDGNTMVYELLSFTDKDGNAATLSGSPTQTIGSTGLTFHKTTGVFGGTPAVGTAAAAPWTARIEADDQQNNALTLSYNFTNTPVEGEPFPNLATSGVVASGGDTSPAYVYSWVSGAVPTWLASNAGATSIDDETGLFVGGTGDVTAFSGTLVFRVTDGSAVTRDVSIVFDTQEAVTDDFASRVVGTKYATNFKDVYINGVLVPSREITDVNNASDYTVGTSEAGTIGTLWGESNGGSGKNSHLDWVVDPTGYNGHVARFYNLAEDGASSGAWVRRVDGAVSGSSSVGTTYPKLFFQTVFWADRNLLGYRYNSDGQMKIMYIGGSQGVGEIVVILSKHTGLYTVFADGSYGTTNDRTDPDNYTAVPGPNPWGSAATETYTPRFDTVWPIGNSTKQAWYEAGGYIRESSSKGLPADLGASLGADYPNKVTGVTTKYLDERAHIIEGVDVGWPASYPVTGRAGRVHLNAWNVIQLCVEYKAPALSSVALWTSKLGDPPVLNMSMVDKFYTSLTGGQNCVSIMNYDTNRVGESRPVGYTDYAEVSVGENRIPWPGVGPNVLPPLPPGLTG